MNNHQVLLQQEEEEEEEAGGGGQLATPDPAAAYLSSGDIASECLVAVMWLSLGALLLGLGFAEALSVGHWAEYVAYLACGGVALAVGCGFFAIACCLSVQIHRSGGSADEMRFIRRPGTHSLVPMP